MESVLVDTSMQESLSTGPNFEGESVMEAAPAADATYDYVESTDHSSQSSVVILKSDPFRLPMVCGLCGDQYATTRELENHMNVHRDSVGITIKRNRGRPKGSKVRKSSEWEETEENSQPSVGVTSEMSANSAGRRSQRSVKRPNSDLYIHDDRELDNLLREEKIHNTNGKSNERESIKIARIDDYISNKVVALSSPIEHEGLNESELNQSLFDIPSKPGADIPSVVSQTGPDSTHPQFHGQDGVRKSDVADMTQLISRNTQIDMSQQVADASGLLAREPEFIDKLNHVDDATHIEVCLEAFSDEFAQQTGNTDEHLSTPLHTHSSMCELCFTVLPADKMRDHMIKVHMNLATQEFACPKPDCNTLYSSIASLRAHMTQQHQVPAVTGNGSLIAPKVYTCEVPGCNSMHRTKVALKLHMSESHADLSQQSTTCEICQKVFKSKRAHSSHMKAHTKILEPVSCLKCHKQFKHPSALKFHMSMMPECDKPKYVCDMCGYKAVTPWRLNSHKQQVHSTARPYTCEFCQKSYKTNEMLRQHKYKLHTGTPTFECNVCNKKFFYAAELREHSQLHATTKQYVCEICNRAFKTMHVYRGHMNGKHSNTWYSCGFCKFTTSHKKSMKRHMILVHKYKNVTLEVTPEPSTSLIPEQVEIIPNDSDLHNLQISENGQQVVIDAMAQVQYDEANQHTVIMQHASTGEMVSHDSITREIISNDNIVGQVITQEQMEELIRNHQVDGSMNASEVTQVLVSLSSGGMAEGVTVVSGELVSDDATLTPGEVVTEKVIEVPAEYVTGGTTVIMNGEVVTEGIMEGDPTVEPGEVITDEITLVPEEVVTHGVLVDTHAVTADGSAGAPCGVATGNMTVVSDTTNIYTTSMTS